jgi:predicted phage terminase large subunit-like protein
MLTQAESQTRTLQPLSRLTAARELQRRRAIRRSLTEYARFKGFEPALHHRLICEEVETFLADPTLDVLMLHAPPGSAKSMYLSVLFPPHYLARYPSNSILAATHSQEFAQRWGRKVRNDILLDGPTLGISVSQDNSASDRWSLTAGGEYYGVGAGVGISGFRADLGMCDDLFGSREDAYSETIREKRWNWYLDDFCGRLKPGAKRILMNTRWHDEDVAGREIARIKSGVVKGRIIDIPAVAGPDDPVGREQGEYLWDEPDGYNYGSFLRARRREVSAMMWSALYQQSPAPEEGDYFKVEWLRPYDKVPAKETLRIYGGSDYAVTSGDGDWTVHAVVGIDPENRMYLLDLWRKQASSDVWVEEFCNLVKFWKPMAWAEETGQIKSGVGPFLEKRQRERQAYVAREQFPTRGDKAVRAQSIRGRMALDGLYVPINAPWYADLRSELLSFPAGKHDDQVDALGLVGQLLDRMIKGTAAKDPDEKIRGTTEMTMAEAFKLASPKINTGRI